MSDGCAPPGEFLAGPLNGFYRSQWEKNDLGAWPPGDRTIRLGSFRSSFVGNITGCRALPGAQIVNRAHGGDPKSGMCRLSAQEKNYKKGLNIGLSPLKILA